MKTTLTINVRLVLLLLLATGTVIRLINYLHGPGLWLDEASLSLNIIERNYFRLLEPLHRNQVAPLFFLWIERFSIQLFGPTELALRLFPLICSLLSLPLYYMVSKEILKERSAALIALFIFALAPIQIRYSAEVKQYMSDVFTLLLILWLFLHHLNTRKTASLIMLTAGGIGSLFLSHVAVFILFLTGIFWLLADRIKSHKDYLKLIPLALWAFVFAFIYFRFYSGHQHEGSMLHYWKNNFMPLNPLSTQFWDFLAQKPPKVFTDFLVFNRSGLGTTWFSIITIIFSLSYFLGIAGLFRKKQSNALYFLLVPIILHLVLSGLKKYPFDTRLALYLSPLVYMTIAYGMLTFYNSLTGLIKNSWPGIVIIALLLTTFPYKLVYVVPFEQDGTRECIRYIRQHYQKGQVVYINQYSANIYKFYRKTGRVNWEGSIIYGTLVGPPGGGQWDPQADLELLNGVDAEMWLLFGHLHYPFQPQYQAIMAEIRKQGKVVETFKSKISAAHRVKLNR